MNGLVGAVVTTPGQGAIDSFFRLHRVAGQSHDDGAALQVRGVLQSYQEILADLEFGTTVAQADIDALTRSFAALLTAWAGLPTAARDIRPLPPGTVQPWRTEPPALRRWLRGHHAFVALIQGLTCAIDALLGSSQDPDPGAAAERLALMTVLVEGAEASLRLTGDLGEGAYERDVRIWMIPPHSPPGLTGLDLWEHSHLLVRVRALGRTADLADGPLHGPLASLRTAWAALYQAHSYVCTRFVAPTEGSLLVKSDGPPVATTLDRLARSRVRLLPTPSPALACEDH
ncbi:hypothetical protein [Streptomyces sp. NPDC093109]|uniref:hypothetical protein n=1 Tax=Streptomyces sp. NPDC093109 TaxID=3154977 RepID=UPI00344E0511